MILPASTPLIEASPLLSVTLSTSPCVPKLITSDTPSTGLFTKFFAENLICADI